MNGGRIHHGPAGAAARPVRVRRRMIVEEGSTARTAIRGHRLLMAAAIVVATAAGIVGAIMLVAPTSTAT
jgi:hypothetical protein